MTKVCAAAFLAAALRAAAADAKPKVWIYTDMSDGTLKGPTHMGTVNDPDDISAMAGYLLMANEFETPGVVVASTHRKKHRTTPDQGVWANRFFGDAYRAEVPALNKTNGGYPTDIRFTQSCIKEAGERYDPAKTYSDSATYWVLLGNWGVSLEDIADNGTNPPAVEAANEKKFRDSSKRIHDEVLRRAKAAGGGHRQ